MSEVYVTLFDSNFLPQGLALYHSLLAHGGDFRLWVICLDQRCHSFLNSLQFDHLLLLNLADLENEQLLKIKASRSRAEYCWTLTPWSIQWVLEADINTHRVTYLDADTFFFANPSSIFKDFETSRRQVLITEHGYAPQYDQTYNCGKYCVQFMTVVRGKGEEVLHWWRDQCLSWCFARFENSLFGDQKYLEHFDSYFQGLVYVLGRDSRLQAPWNSIINCYSDCVMYHFHSLRVINQDLIYVGTYSYLPPHLEYIYKPYCDLIRSLILLHHISLEQHTLQPRFYRLPLRRLKRYLNQILLDQTLSPHWYIFSNSSWKHI